MLHVQARVRAAFISDLHLGTRECQAGQIAAFLRRVEMQTLYLVGDVVDLWSMRRGTDARADLAPPDARDRLATRMRLAPETRFAAIPASGQWKTPRRR